MVFFNRFRVGLDLVVTLDVLLESLGGSIHNFLLLNLKLQLSANRLLHVLDFGLQELFHFVIFVACGCFAGTAPLQKNRWFRQSGDFGFLDLSFDCRGRPSY